jgi:putative membrane protein
MNNATRTIIVVVTTVVLALVAMPLLWGWTMMGGIMGPGMMGQWGGMVSPWGMVISGVVVAAALAGIGLLVASVMQQAVPGAMGDGRRALDILKERYARGELTREQYEQMRRDLE